MNVTLGTLVKLAAAYGVEVEDLSSGGRDPSVLHERERGCSRESVVLSSTSNADFARDRSGS